MGSSVSSSLGVPRATASILFGATMKHVAIYTKTYCPYCHRAKNLLQNKNMACIEYDATDDPAREEVDAPA